MESGIGSPDLLLIFAIGLVTLFIAYRVGYKQGYRDAMKRVMTDRGNPSDVRAYRER
jgi:hypothetical protein